MRSLTNITTAEALQLKKIVLCLVDNAAAYSTGRAAASFTSTAENLETKSERALIDEEECESVDDLSALSEVHC